MNYLQCDNGPLALTFDLNVVHRLARSFNHNNSNEL